MKFLLKGIEPEQYCNMRSGSHWYSSKIWVEAESKEQAYAIACKEFSDLIINDEFIQSEEEIEESERREQEYQKEKERKEKEKAEQKKQKEQEKANSMNIILEQYYEYQRLKRNKQKHACEMRKAYAAIEQAKKDIEYEERKIKYYEEQMNNIYKEQ